MRFETALNAEERGFSDIETKYVRNSNIKYKKIIKSNHDTKLTRFCKSKTQNNLRYLHVRIPVYQNTSDF